MASRRKGETNVRCKREVIFTYLGLSFTVVHPVPTFDDLDALKNVLNRMEELGLYLMYDMRQYVSPFFSLVNSL
jgi:hypothetical protein